MKSSRKIYLFNGGAIKVYNSNRQNEILGILGMTNEVNEDTSSFCISQLIAIPSAPGDKTQLGNRNEV